MHVYVGSFWDQPPLFEDNLALLMAEQRDLFKDIRELPRHSAVQRISQIVKRIRLCKVHSYLIGYMKDEMPTFGKQKKLAHVSIYDMFFVLTLTSIFVLYTLCRWWMTWKMFFILSNQDII